MNPDALIARIMSNSVPDAAGCWIWIGARRGMVYGQINVRCGGRLVSYYAHRLALELATRSGRAGEHADHLCSNPLCVNPAHLRWVRAETNLKRYRPHGRILGPVDLHHGDPFADLEPFMME